MKLILATILAGSFLLSLPVKADDNGEPAKTEKKSAKKTKKSDKKADKGDMKDDQAGKSGGGW